MKVKLSVTRYKLPNVYKSCPKVNSQEKWMILTPLQKLANNVGDLGKIIVATSFEWLPKVQKIAKSGHTWLKLQSRYRVDKMWIYGAYFKV